MKDQIKAVQDYFKNQLIAGKYNLTKLDHYLAVISIEGYVFTFWIANGLNTFRQYSGPENKNFIQLDPNKEEDQIIWEKLALHIKNFKNEEWRQEKLQQFEKLKAELNL